MKLSLILIGCLLLLLLGCSPAVKLNDPVGVVKAEIEAVNRGQNEVASSYFSDEAQIITSFGQPKGKEKIRAFMFNLVRMKERDNIIDLTADGSNVTGKMTITNTALRDNSMATYGKDTPMPVNLKAVVEDAKIVSWEEGSAAK